jgi:hypothetical protein
LTPRNVGRWLKSGTRAQVVADHGANVDVAAEVLADTEPAHGLPGGAV